MLLIFLSEYFEVFSIYYLYCSCKINPLTHFIFLIFHFLFLSETERHHNRLRKADCARTNKNVPWHILAPDAVACDKLHHRASAHRWQVVPFVYQGVPTEFPSTQKEPHLTRHDPSSFIAFRSKNYISPKPLSIAWLMVFIASSSSSPSQTRVISVPHLIPAAITFNTLFATIFFSPQIMVISLLNFIAVWDKNACWS